MNAIDRALLKILSIFHDHDSEDHLKELGISVIDDFGDYKTTGQIFEELKKCKCP